MRNESTEKEAAQKKRKGKEGRRENLVWSLKRINHPADSRCSAQQPIRCRLLTFARVADHSNETEVIEASILGNQCPSTKRMNEARERERGGECMCAYDLVSIRPFDRSVQRSGQLLFLFLN